MKVKSIKDLFRKYNFRPNKKLGQIFLIDENILRKLTGSACIKHTDYVLEIGSGFGNFTKYLTEKAKRVFTVEKDSRLCKMIYEYLGDSQENLKVICSDILKFDLEDLFKDTSEKIKVVGNLPYDITSPIISYLIKNKNYINSVQLVVQKEVADRILAKPSSRDYSFLTLLVQFNFEVLKLFDISKSCFLPVPEVDSTALKFSILAHPKFQVKDEKFLFRLIDAAFKQRRKMLLNAIHKNVAPDISKEEISEIFKRVDINLKARAENLSLEEFSRLSDSLLLKAP